LLVKLKLDANSSSVDSVFGNHGHVFLTLSPAEYTDLHGVPFQIPEQPPIDPPPPPGANANPTAAHLAKALQLHTNAWTAYKLMRATERDLHNQLLAAADNVYIRLGYNMCSIQDMLKDLIESYGRLTKTDVKKLRAVWMSLGKADHSNLSFNKSATPPTRSPLLARLCQRNKRRTSYTTL
jgi:hypothetical protein